jgi:hypothetical protein
MINYRQIKGTFFLAVFSEQAQYFRLTQKRLKKTFFRGISLFIGEFGLILAYSNRILP